MNSPRASPLQMAQNPSHYHSYDHQTEQPQVPMNEANSLYQGEQQSHQHPSGGSPLQEEEAEEEIVIPPQPVQIDSLTLPIFSQPEPQQLLGSEQTSPLMDYTQPFTPPPHNDLSPSHRPDELSSYSAQPNPLESHADPHVIEPQWAPESEYHDDNFAHSSSVPYDDEPQDQYIMEGCVAAAATEEQVEEFGLDEMVQPPVPSSPPSSSFVLPRANTMLFGMLPPPPPGVPQESHQQMQPPESHQDTFFDNALPPAGSEMLGSVPAPPMVEQSSSSLSDGTDLYGHGDSFGVLDEANYMGEAVRRPVDNNKVGFVGSSSRPGLQSSFSMHFPSSQDRQPRGHMLASQRSVVSDMLLRKSAPEVRASIQKTDKLLRKSDDGSEDVLNQRRSKKLPKEKDKSVKKAKRNSKRKSEMKPKEKDVLGL